MTKMEKMIESNNNQILERIRRFKEDRISKIFTNEIPFANYDNAKIVLQLIPVVSFINEPHFDLNRIDWTFNGIKPIKSIYPTWDYVPDTDGRIAYNQSSDENILISSVKIFNIGIIEAIDGFLLRPHNNDLFIRPIDLECHLINSLREYLEILRNLEVGLPIYLYLNLLGINGYKMWIHPDFEGHFMARRINRDNLFLPEIRINNYNIDSARILRPCFNSIWKISGFQESYNYDRYGNWRPYIDV